MSEKPITTEERGMKQTVAYSGVYLVIDCPYCGETTYIDVEDDYGEGHIPEDGRRMDCQKCKKTMLVTEY